MNIEAIQLESGIPLPKRERTESHYRDHPRSKYVRLYNLMKIGDSILFEHKQPAHIFLAAIITLIGKGRMCSKSLECGKVRVWRVE